MHDKDEGNQTFVIDFTAGQASSATLNFLRDFRGLRGANDVFWWVVPALLPRVWEKVEIFRKSGKSLLRRDVFLRFNITFRL